MTSKNELITGNRAIERTEVRKTGIIARRKLTDVIQQFTRYCEANGSTHAAWYYANETTMVYSELGLIDKGYRRKRTRKTDQICLRKKADMDALATIKVAEDILAVALLDGMNANLDYKSVFKSGKKSIQQLAKLLGIKRGE